MKSLSPVGFDLSSTQSGLDSEDLVSETDVWIASPEEIEEGSDCCQNPWNPDCESPEIEVYIVFEKRRIPICRSCWRRISETDIEW